MSNIEFYVVAIQDGKETVKKKLSYEAVSNMVSNASDGSENEDLFIVASKHPSSNVREQVAYKDKLSDEVVDLLSEDKSVAVLRNLVRSQKFKDTASTDKLKSLMSLDVEIAYNIAGDLESYSDADKDELSTFILQHSDPYVLGALAGSYSTPKKTLKLLLKNSDPYVAAQAKSRLDD
jgi:hypothetical protein